VSVFRAELLKVKFSVGFWVAFIAPLIQGAIHFGVFFFNGKHFIKADTNVWELFIHSVWGFWIVLFLPMLIGIQTSLINGLEHQTDGWRSLFCLPIPRWYIYLSKALMSILLVFISNVILIFVTIIVGYLLGLTRYPNFINTPFPSYLWFYPFYAIIGAFLIIIFHWFLSTMVRNFFVCAGVTVILTLFNIIISNEKAVSIYFPWCFPIISIEVLSNKSYVQSYYTMLCSIVLGSLLLIITVLWKNKRNVI
jgi:hypothetical protein